MKQGRMGFFIACCSAIPGLFGAQVLAAPMSLEEARRTALDVFWGVKIAQEQFLAARFERRGRFSDLFPKIVLDGNVSRFNDQTEFEVAQGAFPNPLIPFPSRDTLIPTTDRDTYQIGPTLKQPLFAGGRLLYGYRQSQALERKADWEGKRSINDLFLEVEQAYMKVLELEGERTVRKKSLDFFLRLREDMEAKFKAGSVPVVEVLKVQVEEAKAEERLLGVENDLQVARGEFNLLLARPVDTPFELEPLPDPVTGRIPLEAAQARAEVHRPELNGARETVQAAEYSQRIAEAAFLPQVDFSAKWYRQDLSPTNQERQRWQLLVTADWSLWDWGGTRQRVSEAAAREREARYSADWTLSQIRLEVYQAWLEIQRADQRIDVVGKKRVHAEEMLRVNELGFKAGVTTSTDLMESETLLSQAELDALKARFTARQSRAALRHAIGVMVEESPPGEAAPKESSTKPPPERSEPPAGLE